MNKPMQCEDDLLCGVNTVADMENMTSLEKEHVVVISAPEHIRANEPFDVTIEVGEHMSHRIEPTHYLDFIDLYADDTYIARLGLTPLATSPIMRVRVSLTHIHDTLRAFAHCNIHGTWEGRMQIHISE
ncbi:MAG: hypothetical protein IH624_06970 [Phycisphaerae bacterium]|nr:hypothetical protein [Phycisphaerae bacterium]